MMTSPKMRFQTLWPWRKTLELGGQWPGMIPWEFKFSHQGFAKEGPWQLRRHVTCASLHLWLRVKEAKIKAWIQADLSLHPHLDSELFSCSRNFSNLSRLLVPTALIQWHSSHLALFGDWASGHKLTAQCRTPEVLKTKAPPLCATWSQTALFWEAPQSLGK